MFPYDPTLLAAVQTTPQSIEDVLQILQTIDSTCVDADGLKWFNWLYLQVTQAVQTRVAAAGFADPAWLAQLDVQFAPLYFSAKRTLNVRLPGDALPPISHLEDTIVAWNVSAARESAWQSAEHLWQLRALSLLAASFMDTLDGFTTVIGKALLVPVP
jgi:hypothetical protein